MKTSFLAIQLFFVINMLIAQNFWEPLSGPYGGSIACLAVNSSHTIYAGLEAGGLFRSTDNGEHWIPTQFNGYEWILDVRISPHNETVFANVGNEIYRSTDYGMTWISVLSKDSGAYSTAFDSDGNVYIASYYNGIFYSNNNGNTWANIGNNLRMKSLQRIDVNDNGDIFVGAYGDMYRSSDQGKTWISIINGMGYKDVQAIMFGDENEIYAGTYGGKAYRSTDNGDNWFYIGDSIYSPTVWSLTKDEKYIYAGTSNKVYRSSDHGQTWSQSGTGILSLETLSMGTDPDGNIFAGYYLGGIYKSEDQGNIWLIKNANISRVAVSEIAFNEQGHIFAGTQEIGVYKSTDHGLSWIMINNGLTVGKISGMTFDTSGFIYVSTHGGGVFRSTDNGESWVRKKNGISYYTDLYAITCNPRNVLFIHVIGFYVYRSTDNGENWIHCQGYNGEGIENFVHKGSLTYSVGSHVYCTTDDGITWNMLHSIGARAIGVDNLGILYKPKSVYGMLYTLDTGKTWNETLYPSFLIEGFDMVCLSTGDVYMVGGSDSYSSVIKSTDHGLSWYKVNSGLDCPFSANCIRISPDGYLYVGTSTNGIYRSVNRVVDIGENPMEIPSGFTLYQNYPNPFNPSTTIRYQLTKPSEVRLKIYNILGQEVRTLITALQSEGTHEVTWDGKDNHGIAVSSGVYLYRIECEGITKTRKLTLIR